MSRALEDDGLLFRRERLQGLCVDLNHDSKVSIRHLLYQVSRALISFARFVFA